jgi:hypothetical protein
MVEPITSLQVLCGLRGIHETTFIHFTRLTAIEDIQHTVFRQLISDDYFSKFPKIELSDKVHYTRPFECVWQIGTPTDATLPNGNRRLVAFP